MQATQRRALSSCVCLSRCRSRKAEDKTLRFVREGLDLVIEVGSKVVVVEGYFAASPPPLLMTNSGGRFSPALVASFLEQGGDFAQKYALGWLLEKFSADEGGMQAIGEIISTEGMVQVVRDGLVMRLKAGDMVLEGDIVSTGEGAEVFMRFNRQDGVSLGRGGASGDRPVSVRRGDLGRHSGSFDHRGRVFLRERIDRLGKPYLRKVADAAGCDRDSRHEDLGRGAGRRPFRDSVGGQGCLVARRARGGGVGRIVRNSASLLWRRRDYPDDDGDCLGRGGSWRPTTFWTAASNNSAPWRRANPWKTNPWKTSPRRANPRKASPRRARGASTLARKGSRCYLVAGRCISLRPFAETEERSFLDEEGQEAVVTGDLEEENLEEENLGGDAIAEESVARIEEATEPSDCSCP